VLEANVTLRAPQRLRTRALCHVGILVEQGEDTLGACQVLLEFARFLAKRLDR
jgi:hypothetical protein